MRGGQTQVASNTKRWWQHVPTRRLPLDRPVPLPQHPEQSTRHPRESAGATSTSRLSSACPAAPSWVKAGLTPDLVDPRLAIRRPVLQHSNALQFSDPHGTRTGHRCAHNQ